MSTREDIFNFVHGILKILQDIDFFEGRNLVVNGFDVQFSDGSDLAERNFAAAFFVDPIGIPVIYVNQGFSLNSHHDLHCLVHESIHIAQVMKGDYEFSVMGKVFWKGEIYEGLHGSDPNYFDESYQPWEAEVERLLPVVLQHVCRHFAE